MEIVSFGEWLQKRRRRLDLTRRALAQMVGCSSETIKKIERDERRPSRQIARLLAAHLQIPDAETEDFIRRARGQLEVRSESASIELATEPPAGAAHYHLPLQPTPFIGRERELDALVALLAQNNLRLVTIVGPGGMGKTRLAVAVAARLLAAAQFAHGVFVVSLAPLNDPEQIVPALAEALRFPLASGEQQRRTARQQILDYGM
jgi:transcriptional regulator with XRE-family HTH domain